MKMIATVQGIKRSKGVMRDSGKEYDSTTVWVRLPFDESDGNMRGSATEAFKFGKSDNYEKFAGLKLPFEAEIDIDTMTDGKKVKQVISDIVPLRVKPQEQK